MSELDVRRWTADDYRQARQSVLGSALPPTSRLLLLVLIEHMPHCSPSIERLMAQTGHSRSTVIRTLAQLEAGGVLRVERAQGRRSVYRLTPAEGWPVAAPANDTSVTMTRGVCHHDTGSTVEPVSPRHGYQCHHDTGGVSPRHGGGVMVTPKAGSKADLKAGSDARASELTEAQSGVFAAPLLSTRHRQYPPGWQWSAETEADAAMQGVTPAELREHVAYWTTHEWGPAVTDLDGELRRRIPDIRNRSQTQRAKARASTRGAVVTAASVEPKAKHVRFAEHYRIDIHAIIAELHDRKTVETLGTDRFHELLEQALAVEAKRKVDSGEVAPPKPRSVSR